MLTSIVFAAAGTMADIAIISTGVVAFARKKNITLKPPKVKNVYMMKAAVSCFKIGEVICDHLTKTKSENSENK